MYHIKDDKRSQTSAQMISNGLINCLESKSFFNITITDVQQAAGVGRATFYRIFDSMTDVLAYQCDKVFDEIVVQLEGQTDKESDKILIIFIEHWIKNEKLLETIIECNRLDILLDTHWKNSNRIKDYFFTTMTIESEQLDYFFSVLTSVMISVLITWVKHGRKDTSVQLYQRVKGCSQLFCRMMV